MRRDRLNAKGMTHKTLFYHANKKGHEVVGRNEFIEGLAVARIYMSARAADDLFMAVDLNGDGRVSWAELQAVVDADLDKISGKHMSCHVMP